MKKSKSKVYGEVSDLINGIIKKHAMNYGDKELTEAINEHPIIKENGIVLNKTAVRQRRVTLGFVRTEPGTRFERTAGFPELDVRTFSFDGDTDRTSWNWESRHQELVKEYVERSQKLDGRTELQALSNELLKRLQEDGRGDLSTHNLRTYIFRQGWRWGKGFAKLQESDAAAINRLLEEKQRFTSTEAFLDALLTEIPRIKTRVGMQRRITDLKISLPEFREHGVTFEGNTKLTTKSWVRQRLEQFDVSNNVPGNMPKLLKLLNDELPAYLHEAEGGIGANLVYGVIDTLYWKDRKQMIESAIKASWDAEKLHDLLSKHGHGLIPPLWLVKDKLEEVKGRSHAPREIEEFSLRGILRVDISDSKVELPKRTSYDEPFHALAGNTQKQLSIAIISGAQIGLPFDPDIHQNLTRCAFATARKVNGGCDAIVLGGGLFRIMLQKTTGPARMLYDLLASGQDIDPLSVAVHYRERAMETIKSGDFKPIFVTAGERLKELLRGWWKVTNRPNSRPEFGGPVYIVLSDEDLKIAQIIAYFDSLFEMTQQNREAGAQVRLYAELKAKSYELWLEASRVYGTDSEEAKEYDQKLKDAQKVFDEAVELQNRTRATNFDGAQDVRVFEQATRWLISRIEESIPHAKVVDRNSAFIRFGAHKEIGRFVCASGSGQGSTYYSEMGNFGPIQRTGKLTDYTVVMNPASSYVRRGERENYLGGKTVGTSHFIEAPLLIDAPAISRSLAGFKSIRVPAVKAAMDPMFTGGMVIISIDQANGIHITDLNIEKVRAQGQQRALKKPAKIAYIAAPTDWHVGGQHRVMIPRHDGIPTYPTEAFFELLRRSMDEDGAVHVTSVQVMDDIMHGNHYGTHEESSRLEIPAATIMQDVSAELHRLVSLGGKKESEGYQALVRFLVTQIAIRAPHNMTGQFQELVAGVLEPYADVFRGVLLRAKKSGVILRGVGELTTGRPDKADVGVITFGSGNHAAKTLQNMFQEGPAVAAVVRAGLRNDPLILKAGIDINRWVASPVYGKQSIGMGRISFGGGPEYGLHILGTPPQRDSWHDTLHGWVQVNRRVGNPSGIFDGIPMINLAGDKHIPSWCVAGGDVYMLGPANTHTDAFAYMAGGLPENPPGIGFVGVPADGINTGPIHMGFISISLLREYLEHPTRKFPFEEIMPNRF